MDLKYCTLTGVDDWTNLSELIALSKEFEFAEWGVLYSPERAGTGRYPSILKGPLMDRLHFANINIALHVCGLGVNELMSGQHEWLNELASMVGRVQLNLRAERFGADAIREVATRLYAGGKGPCVILQANAGNLAVCEELDGHPGMQFLWDSSGGRGVRSGEWPSMKGGAGAKFKRSMFGWAGGLGPDNVSDELPKIAEAACGNPFWIDMEQRLRSDEDRLDLIKAARTLALVGRLYEASEAGAAW